MSSLSLSASYQSFFITLDKIKKTKLPCSWNVLTTECNKPACFYKMLDIPSYSQHQLKISHSVVVNLDLSWKITVHGYEVTSEVCSTLFDGIPSVISSSTQLTNLLYRIDALNVCPGYPDKHFVSMVQSKKGILLNSAADVAAYVDDKYDVHYEDHRFSETVRTSDCLILTKDKRCSQCTSYQQNLCSIYNRWQKRQTISPSLTIDSHVNERWLNTPERKEKMIQMKSKLKNLQKQNKYLLDKIKESNKLKGVKIDDDLHIGLSEIMKEHSEEVQKRYCSDSFHYLFWNEQIKNTLKHPTQRRWHPMLIRWCLHLRMISSTAYDTLRGILVLPCGRTLQDYTHFIKAGVGVQADVTKQLLYVSKMNTLEDYQKYVALVFDEMKIKEGIVYDKNECKVVGFVDVGGINNKLRLFEESLTADDDDHSENPLVAKHMLVFMVRGVFIKLQFPYAQYPTRDLTADVLFPLVWEVIRNLEAAGYKVISLTGDKGSCNTKFFRLHNKIAKSEVTYKVPTLIHTLVKNGTFILFLMCLI